MNAQKLFAITSNSDTTEGRGRTLIHGYCKEKAHAVQIIKDERFYKKYGVMGCPAYKAENDALEIDIIVFDNPEEFFSLHNKENLRLQALKKLTKEEKEALGLV